MDKDNSREKLPDYSVVMSVYAGEDPMFFRESLESISFAAGECYTESAKDIRVALKTAYENMRSDKERYHARHP